MKKISRKILITMIVMIGIFMSSINVLAATEATVEIDPETPKRKEMVTFTAEITSDETIQEVTLIVQECNDKVCFEKNYVTLEESGNVYTGDFTLLRTDTVYMQYWLEITTDQGTNETAITKVYLDTSSTNGGTNGESNDNPGFELFTILIAIIIGVILVKRKRSR
ncbi:hypothetical protein AYK20_09455 [Thermoplasmatales archaeon SG8-52-1]|nr:MAG: hypothetical protein AYK20_09455 [Thermoplasmatales archaeon SG8-52-1]